MVSHIEFKGASKRGVFCPTLAQKILRVRQGKNVAEFVSRRLHNKVMRTQSLKASIEQVFMACHLEGQLSHDQLVRYYLEDVYFGSRDYGLHAVARTLFDKVPADLSDAEALSTAVLIKQPSMRNIPERWHAREAAYAYLIQ